MRVKYVGPYTEGAEIAATGQTVKPGETAEVDDELGRALCAQADNWQPVTGSKAATAAKGDDD